MKKLLLAFGLFTASMPVAFSQPTDADRLSYANNLVLSSMASLELPLPGHKIKQERITTTLQDQIIAEDTINYDEQGTIRNAHQWQELTSAYRVMTLITKNEKNQWEIGNSANGELRFKAIYQLDEQGQLVLYTIKNQKPDDKNNTILSYDKNRLVSMKMYDRGTLCEENYSYNDLGYLLEDHNCVRDIKYHYDSEGRLIKKTINIKKPEGVPELVWEFSNFDQQGNWQTVDRSKDPNRKTTRTIVYY